MVKWRRFFSDDFGDSEIITNPLRCRFEVKPEVLVEARDPGTQGTVAKGRCSARWPKVAPKRCGKP